MYSLYKGFWKSITKIFTTALCKLLTVESRKAYRLMNSEWLINLWKKTVVWHIKDNTSIVVTITMTSPPLLLRIKSQPQSCMLNLKVSLHSQFEHCSHAVFLKEKNFWWQVWATAANSWHCQFSWLTSLYSSIKIKLFRNGVPVNYQKYPRPVDIKHELL